MDGLTRENSHLIGFVIASLFGEAISTEELRQWADHIMLTRESVPEYIVELSQFEGYLKDIYRIIGFSPSRGLTDVQRDAITGIAFLRGKRPYESRLDKNESLSVLRQHPEILIEFRNAFSFIEIAEARAQ